MKLLIALALLAQEDEKPYIPKHKIDFKLCIEEAEGEWRFVVEGTTDLPDGVRLRTRVYALEEVDEYRGGKRIDEEGLTQKSERAYREFVLKDGRFREVAFDGRRRPYSLPYRARIFYEPDRQDNEDLVKKVDEREFAVHVDFRRGTEADFDRELKETAGELGRELDEVQKLFREFKAAFLEQQKKFDEKAWAAWSRKWLDRVQSMTDRNEERWLLWAVWLERQGRFRIEGFGDRFVRMLDECTEALRGDKDALEKLQRSFEFFLVYYDEAREVMGVDAPFDPEAVGTTLAPYAEVVARLWMLVDKSDRAGWTQEGEQLRVRARAALLALGHPKLVPRRGYERVVGLSERFLRIYDATDRVLSGKGDAEDAARLKALLTDHERTLRAFREYAGLK